MLRQHCGLTEDLRHFADSWLIEHEPDLRLVDLLRSNHVLVIGGKQGVQPLEYLQGIYNVVGRDGSAVMPLRERPQPEADPSDING
jgi:hypothetical protein